MQFLPSIFLGEDNVAFFVYGCTANVLCYVTCFFVYIKLHFYVYLGDWYQVVQTKNIFQSMTKENKQIFAFEEYTHVLPMPVKVLTKLSVT